MFNVNGDGRLVHFAQLPAALAEGGCFTLTQKFIAGMASYAKLWDGPVRAVLPLAPEPTLQLDNITVHPSELPFEMEVLKPGETWTNATRGASAVLSGLSHGFTDLASPLKKQGIPLIYVTELTLKTRQQIVRSSAFGALIKARKLAWEQTQEWRNLRAIKQSAGLQANGTPTYRAYQTASPDPLLFFDSRTTEANLATPEHLEARFATRRQQRRIRLVFSGRLISIKGVDHLVPLARALRERNVPFTLDIFGGGDCEDALREALVQHQLEDVVTMRGSVDFQTELMPQVRDNFDLFVCCHRQGDPSCTYLETFSLGVPVVGYDNEALTGFLEHVEAGRPTALDDVERLAECIASVSQDESMLESWSRNALEFARQHTFERTSERRMDHVRRHLQSHRAH